jgi:hypothetical protein
MSEKIPQKTPEASIKDWETFRKTLEYRKIIMKILKMKLEEILVPNFLIQEDGDIDETASYEEILRQLRISKGEDRILVEIFDLETIEAVRQYCVKRELNLDIDRIIADTEKNWDKIALFLKNGKTNIFKTQTPEGRKKVGEITGTEPEEPKKPN